MPNNIPIGDIEVLHVEGKSELIVAHMVGQLGTQRPLQKRLHQLLEKPLIAQKVFRRLVINQQLVQKLGSQCRHRRVLLYKI